MYLNSHTRYPNDDGSEIEVNRHSTGSPLLPLRRGLFDFGGLPTLSCHRADPSAYPYVSHPQIAAEPDSPPSARALCETELVTCVQAGDVDAYGDLMRLHVRDVRAYIALRAPAQHLIDDVSHESFVVAFDKIADFEAGTSFKKWIRAIAWQLLRREVQKFAATERNRERLAEHLAVEKARTAKSSNATLDDLERCLDKVPEVQRGLLDLKYTEGQSTTEMAAALDKSEDWVRTMLYRVRNQLRDCINQLKAKSR